VTRINRKKYYVYHFSRKLNRTKIRRAKRLSPKNSEKMSKVNFLSLMFISYNVVINLRNEIATALRTRRAIRAARLPFFGGEGAHREVSLLTDNGG